MTARILIETLTEAPDLQLLNELFSIVKKTDSLIIPDVRKFFNMINCLYMCKNEKIINRVFEMNQHINKIMLVTEIQISWQHFGKSLVKLCGEQNSEIRKRARSIILEILNKSNNSYMILQKLFYEGLQDQSIIVMIYSIKLIFKILQMTPNILAKKSCTSLIKLILQKMIRLASSNHNDLKNNADHFLHRLFFLKIDKMDEVLQRLDPYYLKSLENIWEKNKQNLLYKNQQALTSQAMALKEIKYQHLPIINEKIFGVYQPFIIKNLFNPQTQAAKKYSISQLKQQFLQNQDRLTKYSNSLCKIIVKLLPERYLQILELLKHIVSIPGITNIININDLISQLINQLDSQNVLYRRQLREILKLFNCLSTSSKIIIKKYQESLENDQEEVAEWLKIYEILCLVEHWAQTVDAVYCYPPTLNFVVKFISSNLTHKVGKIKNQCEKLLYFILEKFSGYRESLDEYFNAEMVGKFQDIMESKKAYKIPLDKRSKQAKDTFLKQFDQQRLKFLKKQNK